MALPVIRTAVFLPIILPQAPGCPRFFAEQAARLAAIEFCERTRCWRHIIEVSLTANGQAIVAPDYSAIHEIEEATHDGAPLTPTQWTDTDPDELTGAVQIGRPRYLTQIDQNTVSIYPFQAGLLRVSLFLKPRSGQLFGTDPNDPLHDAYNVVPEFLSIQKAEAITDGALARILATPEERWTDPKRAMFHLERFERACNSAFSTHMRTQTRAKIRTTARWF
ncbi:hypothetical protein SAMN05421774_10862 [Gemmobacter megaterium]|uniref:Uncharacterized protein n=1 Tax=Gemmobacter megaterium TaxID=1086013 RepID=A0A1N7QAX6_9RHOB|nr:hypothetical protein [Gemmobacter megaterium]GGE24279.1 hypothetical protein GCM10011345_32830 [Gemmobacter megaterium]SIT20001.1 hypothetical protein SAMN05421774_10862 [Gemmobacter megaterium]